MLTKSKESIEALSGIYGIISGIIGVIFTFFCFIYTFSLFSNSMNPISFTLSDNEKKSKFVSGNTIINAIKLFIPMFLILSVWLILAKYIFKKNNSDNEFLYTYYLFIFGFFLVLYSLKEYFQLIFTSFVENIPIKKLVTWIKKIILCIVFNIRIRKKLLYIILAIVFVIRDIILQKNIYFSSNLNINIRNLLIMIVIYAITFLIIYILLCYFIKILLRFYNDLKEDSPLFIKLLGTIFASIGVINYSILKAETFIQTLISVIILSIICIFIIRTIIYSNYCNRINTSYMYFIKNRKKFFLFNLTEDTFWYLSRNYLKCTNLEKRSYSLKIKRLKQKVKYKLKNNDYLRDKLIQYLNELAMYSEYLRIDESIIDDCLKIVDSCISDQCKNKLKYIKKKRFNIRIKNIKNCINFKLISLEELSKYRIYPDIKNSVDLLKIKL
jgi:membrane protein